ncbi:TATA box binding protein associated factor-domain-containing protein [Chiua virens]|nr:TATA box binding protein associated factor-domain-containing protein [Chiua virens]
MSKPGPKPKLTQTYHAGVYKADSVKDVAESLGISSLPDVVASALASDVEYRTHQVIEEAARYMRHARRTVLTTADIDLALRTLNIEPLYGHTPHAPGTFRRALPFPHLASAGTVYFVEDEEIDFDRVLKEEKITVPRGVNWTAHWLAVEGVQPLVPENPPAIPREEPTLAAGEGKPSQPGTTPASSTAQGRQLAPATQQTQQNQLVKQVLSKELQLYYNRLTSSLLPSSSSASDTTKRTAALASLRGDAGLQALLPYLVRWVGEGVVNALREGEGESEGKTLEVLLDVVGAILENKTLFIEPYLHQILPSILSTLLHSHLPRSHAIHLRTATAQTLGRLLTQHSTTYPSLSPRIMKTLLVALLGGDGSSSTSVPTSVVINGFESLAIAHDPSNSEPRGAPKPLGTREGAIRGLVGIGKEAVRKGVLEGGGARVVGEECAKASGGEAVDGVVDAVMIALQTLSPMSDMPESLDRTREENIKVIAQLKDILGEFFAEKVIGRGDRAWVMGIVQSVHS